MEVKSFLSASPISDFEQALGQYLLYEHLLQAQYPDRILYLAVRDTTYDNFFQEEIVQIVLNKRHLKLLIFDEEHTRYLVITEGWNGKKRIHSLLFDAEIRNGKIWLHHDGLDHGITDELVTVGVPKDHIVLAFHPPHIRPHTGYAVA